MFRDNKTHEARKYFEIAVRNEPLHASAHINLGISHMIDKDGDIRIADEHFRTVLSFSPLSTGTSSQLTITAARLRAFLHDGYGMKPEQFPERRDPVKAIEAYRYHLKLESNNANARHRLYVLLRSEGRLEEAREIFPNDHDDALIRAEMALAYKLLKEEKQFQEAETLIWNLIKRIKDKIQIVNLADTIGTVYVSKKLYAEAARAYDVAVKADPTRARLWNNLGHVQLHLKLVDEAEMNVLKALELDPSLKSAKVNMEVIETFRSSL
jgi:tetratricopeptide (TPR) repeat protein